jgi:hypothetical protein
MKIKLLALALIAFATMAFTTSDRVALINDQNQIVRFDTNIDPLLVGTEDGWRWVIAPEAVKPAYNPDTQYLEGPVAVVGANEVTSTYTVKAKTPQMIDSDKEVKLNSLDLFVLQTLCDHENRIRVLEGLSAITLQQCRAAIKARM